MKVKFLKVHLNYKTDDIADLPDGQAEYLVRVGAAKKTREKKEVDDGDEKAEPAATKKAAPKKASKQKQAETPKAKH